MTWVDIPLGITREQLIELLGEPHDISCPTKRNKIPVIYKYNEIEYHFLRGKDGTLVLIFDNATHITLKKC